MYQAALSLYQLDGESIITTESGLPLQLSVARLLGTAQGLYQCAVENLLIALDHECPACDYRDGFHEAMLLAMCDIADIIIAEEGASKDIETAKPVGIEASIAEAACATADNYTEYQIVITSYSIHYTKLYDRHLRSHLGHTERALNPTAAPEKNKPA